MVSKWSEWQESRSWVSSAKDWLEIELHSIKFENSFVYKMSKTAEDRALRHAKAENGWFWAVVVDGHHFSPSSKIRLSCFTRLVMSHILVLSRGTEEGRTGKTPIYFPVCARQTCVYCHESYSLSVLWLWTGTNWKCLCTDFPAARAGNVFIVTGHALFPFGGSEHKTVPCLLIFRLSPGDTCFTGCHWEKSRLSGHVAFLFHVHRTCPLI